MQPQSDKPIYQVITPFETQLDHEFNYLWCNMTHKYTYSHVSSPPPITKSMTRAVN